MVPLGILTAITSAIRVQGPSIVKSFIGRGRENRALAEVELMSSTSKEVCELSNGTAIIRMIGKPTLAQLLVFPDEYKKLHNDYREEDRKFQLCDPPEKRVEPSCGIHSLATAVDMSEENRNNAKPLIKVVGMLSLPSSPNSCV